mgnify:CR=1 FL=1
MSTNNKKIENNTTKYNNLKRKKREIIHMTDLEKKLNKIYNYADLIHTENILMLSILSSLLNEETKSDIEKCIKRYIQQRENILSGLYEDDVDITQ